MSQSLTKTVIVIADTEEIDVNCKLCGHGWIPGYLPMEARKLLRLLKNMICPKCGANSEEIKMGKKKELTLH